MEPGEGGVDEVVEVGEGDEYTCERFLAPHPERELHEVVICFRLSSEEGGFYLVLLDGEPIFGPAPLP